MQLDLINGQTSRDALKEAKVDILEDCESCKYGNRVSLQKLQKYINIKMVFNKRVDMKSKYLTGGWR